MLKWRQLQLIADKVLGQDRGIVRPGDLDEPWATIYHRVQAVTNPEAAHMELWRASEGLDDRLRLVTMILPSVPAPHSSNSCPYLAFVASPSTLSLFHTFTLSNAQHPPTPEG